MGDALRNAAITLGRCVAAGAIEAGRAVELLQAVFGELDARP
jgi:hypothetical protein